MSEEEWDSEDAEDFCQDDDRYDDDEGKEMLYNYAKSVGIYETNIDDVARELRMRKSNQDFKKTLRKRRAMEIHNFHHKTSQQQLLDYPYTFEFDVVLR